MASGIMSAQRALGSTVGFAVLGSILAAALTATLSAHLANALPRSDRAQGGRGDDHRRRQPARLHGRDRARAAHPAPGPGDARRRFSRPRTPTSSRAFASASPPRWCSWPSCSRPASPDFRAARAPSRTPSARRGRSSRKRARSRAEPENGRSALPAGHEHHHEARRRPPRGRPSAGIPRCPSSTSRSRRTSTSAFLRPSRSRRACSTRARRRPGRSRAGQCRCVSWSHLDSESTITGRAAGPAIVEIEFPAMRLRVRCRRARGDGHVRGPVRANAAACGGEPGAFGRRVRVRARRLHALARETREGDRLRARPVHAALRVLRLERPRARRSSSQGDSARGSGTAPSAPRGAGSGRRRCSRPCCS